MKRQLGRADNFSDTLDKRARIFSFKSAQTLMAGFRPLRSIAYPAGG
jgi:hypothetical protein